MKKIKLFGLLSLFVIPILGNVSFSATSKYEPHLATSELKDSNKNSLANPNPVMKDCFRVNGTLYDTFAQAIAAVNEGGIIQVLKDYETEHEVTTDADLPKVNITKSLTINGIGDDGLSHQIIGQKINISGSATVNFENVIINGDKEFNKDGREEDHYLINCSDSTINLNKHTVITNYKFDGFCVIGLTHSVLNINDQTKITNCAAKFGVIRLNPAESGCSEVHMYGGEICDNSSSNRGASADGYVEGLIAYVAGGADSEAGTPAKFYMYGGRIYNNDATCWDEGSDKKCHSVGLIFLHSNYVDIRFLGGSISDNVTKLGGAVCFGYHADGTPFDYRPFGNIEIGGDAIVYGNHGVDDNEDTFNSNIYIDRPGINNKNVVVSEDYPLTAKSKTGILFSEEDLPGPGLSKTAVKNASLSDLSHFVADNKDYTTIYEGDAKHSIAIYQYTAVDPQFTPPILVDRGSLNYTGNPQCLIYTPGSVVEDHGGTMMYSTDYEGDITTAHWTNNPNEVTGTDATNYNVTYYVTENTTIGTIASTPVTIATNIIPNASLTSASISNIEDQTYTGGQIEPTLVIKDGNRTLTEGTDYTVEYSNNIEIGTATVKVTLKGNYSGVIEKTFAIVPVACIVHWFMLVVLLLGLGAYAFIFLKKKKDLYVYITCATGVFITCVLAFFGSCSICLAFGITSIIVFILGAGFIRFKMHKEETE